MIKFVPNNLGLARQVSQMSIISSPPLLPSTTQRVTYATWKELSIVWMEGIIDRLSLFALKPCSIAIIFDDPLLDYVTACFSPYLKTLYKSCVKQITITPILAETEEGKSTTLKIYPSQESYFNLVIIPPLLHRIGDVPGLLIQAQKLLSPGGLCVVCFIGNNTLWELKTACAEIDVDLLGGLYQRFIPMISTKDGGRLMQRAGFKEVTSDLDSYHLSAPSINCLIHKLRDSGATFPILYKSLHIKNENHFLLEQPQSANASDILKHSLTQQKHEQSSKIYWKAVEARCQELVYNSKKQIGNKITSVIKISEIDAYKAENNASIFSIPLDFQIDLVYAIGWCP